MSKLLLVEDNELNRDMLKRRLEHRGYEILIAVDGQEAIEIAQKELPLLILMDLSLPIVDGWEATRILKSQESTRHIPIIALTAHAMVGDREKAMQTGCDDYLTKPIDLPLLVETIQRLLPS